VFGERSYATWNVDGFKTMHDGSYHAGKAGLQPGDVVLFDWDHNGIGNHTEMCVSGPDASGSFRTIGANGTNPALVVAYRTRNAYVLGYFRPNWASSTGEDDMSAEQYDALNKRFDNVEAILANDSASGHPGGIRGTLDGLNKRFDNVEGILARDDNGGIRGTVASILAKLAGLTTGTTTIAKLGDDDLARIAKAVNDEQAARLKS
jgi:hypothetical protein